MSLQRRSPHTGGCLFILFTVVILMVCSAPVFENNEKLVANSPVGRHIIHPIRLSHSAESSDLKNEASQFKLERLKHIPTYLDDSSDEDKVNTRKKKFDINRSPRRFKKLVKRSEEKEEEKSEEKEYEKSKEEVDENSVNKEGEASEEKDEERHDEKREEKDEDKEDDEDVNNWDVKVPRESESIEQPGEKNGISPVKGPYLNISGHGPDDTPGSSDDESAAKHTHTHTFRNWEEYLQSRKDGIRKAVSSKAVEGRSKQKESFRKPVNRPVIHSDDHFRFIDKLFKAKNDKVKAFHALVLYMKQQGKSFKIPQRPTEKTTANPNSSNNEQGMGNGTTT